MKILTAYTIIIATFLSACAALPSTPQLPTPLPTKGSVLPPTELKYRVLDQFPDFFYCDPDYYPIAFADEMDLARRRFPELQAHEGEFNIILDHNALSGLSTFTDEQKLLIYREHKKLAAVYFELEQDKFNFQIQTGTEGQQGFIVTGAIDGRGSIDIQEREPSFPACPICLAENTRIDTPQGMIPVQDLRVGDVVWTMSATGERLAAPILKMIRVAVPVNHQMVHVVLEDERELSASPGHPASDGRRLSDLKPGDLLDGASIILFERLSYEGIATYDILPSGDTGFYWANGILLGSTLLEK